MKKILLILMLLACIVGTASAVTYDEDNYDNHISVALTRGRNDPIGNFIKEVSDILEGDSSTTVASMLFAQSTSDPTLTEGMLWYDATAEAFKYRDSDSNETIAAESGTVSLDVAYNNGYAIDVDGSAVTLTVSDTDNNAALVVAQNDSTNDPDAMNITSAADAATAVGLQIDCTAGFDIQGTSDSWSISIAGIFDGEGLTGLTNSQGILFDTDNEIQFGDNSEDISFAFSSNTVTLTTDTGVDSFAFGVVDDLEGVGTIVFDAAAASITLTADAGTEDLTISQAGAVDASLVLTSAGTSTTDALIITSVTGSTKINSADNLDIDAADDITIDTAGGSLTATTVGGDITLDASDKSVIIRGTEEAGDAIVIDADGTAGGIDVAFGTGDLAITGTGASADFTVDADLISIDGTGTSNITVTGGAGEDFTVATAGAADLSLILSSTGTAEDALQITTSAGGINITNGGAAGGEDIDIDAVLASLNINADEDVADAVTVTASTGGIDITADGAAGKDLDLVCTHGSTNISGGEAIADAVTIAAGAGGVDISAAATFDIDITATGGKILGIASEAAADQFKIDAQGTIAGNAINLETTNGGILLNADGVANGDITIDAADDVTITAVGKVTMNLGAEASTYQGNLLPATIKKQTVTTGSLSTADCGYVNQVAVDAQTITLPATVAGVEFTIMNTAADDASIITVELDNADKFIGAGLTPDDGEAIVLTKVGSNYGDYIKVSAHTDGWIITEMVGTWAEASP